MKIKFWHAFVFALFLRLVLAPTYSHPDVGNHVDWGVRFYEYGAGKFYAPESNVWAFTWPNQPPGTILIFALVRKVYELVFSLFWTINVSIPVFPSGIITLIDKHLYIVLLKLPAMFADLGIAGLIYKFLVKYKHPKAAKFGAILFLFNPVIWYNSSVWGQTDAVISFLALLSLWFLLAKKPVFSAVSLGLCLFVKISLVIFIPFYLIAFFKYKFSAKQLVLSFGATMLIVALLTLPFSYPREPFGWLAALYQEKVLTNQLQVITANAFNIWTALTGVVEQPHSALFGPLSYQLWGAGLFLIFYLPLLYRFWVRPVFETLVWVLALSAFSSFLLLTNMHERYLYPLFPYFTILAAKDRKLLPFYACVSAINLINLYHLWWVPKMYFVQKLLSYSSNLLPRLLGLINTLLFGAIYLLFWRRRREV